MIGEGRQAEHLANSERSYIQAMLDAHGGHMQNTVKALGISRKNLWEKMRKLGIAK